MRHRAVPRLPGFASRRDDPDQEILVQITFEPSVTSPSSTGHGDQSVLGREETWLFVHQAPSDPVPVALPVVCTSSVASPGVNTLGIAECERSAQEACASEGGADRTCREGKTKACMKAAGWTGKQGPASRPVQGSPDQYEPSSTLGAYSGGSATATRASRILATARRAMGGGPGALSVSGAEAAGRPASPPTNQHAQESTRSAAVMVRLPVREGTAARGASQDFVPRGALRGARGRIVLFWSAMMSTWSRSSTAPPEGISPGPEVSGAPSRKGSPARWKFG